MESLKHTLIRNTGSTNIRCIKNVCHTDKSNILIAFLFMHFIYLYTAYFTIE